MKSFVTKSAVAVMAALPTLAMAQDHAAGSSVGKGLAVLGGGMALVGAGIGIGLIGRGMTEAMARQPEIAGKIQVGAIILTVFLEGAALFAVAAGFLAV